MQVANYNGQNVMNERVKEGDMVVVPQFFPAIIRAGNNGLEFVAFRRSGTPIKSHFAVAKSVLQDMPLVIMSQIYQSSLEEAEQLKNNRGTQAILLPPSARFRDGIFFIYIYTYTSVRLFVYACMSV